MTRVTLKRIGKDIFIHLYDMVYARDFDSELPNSVYFPINIDGILECKNSKTGLRDTLGFTAGEVMDIFQFKFIWEAPRV